MPLPLFLGVLEVENKGWTVTGKLAVALVFFKFKQSLFHQGSSHAHPNTSVLLTIGFRYESSGLIDYDANGDNPLRSFQEEVNGITIWDEKLDR